MSALLANAEESPHIDPLVALDVGELNDASANDAGRIFDDHSLTRLIRRNQPVDVDPSVRPRPEFSIEHAADRHDRDLRLLLGWRFKNGDIAKAWNEKRC